MCDEQGATTLAYLARKSSLTSRMLVAAQLVAARVSYIRAHEPEIAVAAWDAFRGLPTGRIDG